MSHIDDRKFKDVAIPKGEAIKSWPLYRDILEADKVINLPIAKHHSLSGLTLSFKNWMGVMGVPAAASTRTSTRASWTWPP